jgi:tetratricopeptide (TPR) repeat protein
MLSTLWAVALLAAPPDAGVTPTRSTMREAFSALANLLPLTSTRAALEDPKNAAAIAQNLDTLAGLRHAFPDDPKAQEPATAALSSLFARYAQDTRRRFEARELEAVGLRVRTLTSLCFTCHSRERAPADFADVQHRLDGMTLAPLEKAQLLAATRQFDAALETYRGILDARPANERALLEYARALQDTMAILVRVKDDAKATGALLDALVTREDLPPFMRSTIAAWRADVTAWQQERFDALEATPDALFRRAKELVQKADGRHILLADERHDVAYLRASGYLNLALGRNPALKTRGEALWLLGVCAGALKSPLLWDVDLLFFEACVREYPKTKLAKRCFQQFSDRVYLGYTGSSGTHLPDDELERLTELRALAE